MPSFSCEHLDVGFKPRRLAVIEMDIAVLLALLTKRRLDEVWVCEGLPEDAEAVSVSVVNDGMSVRLLVRSDSFGVLGEGWVPPTISVSWMKHKLPEPAPAVWEHYEQERRQREEAVL